MPVRLVVTDMDGTLYSWIDYIVPAVEAMVDAVCLATRMPRIRVVQSLKTVYAKYESNEYPYALQESTLYEEFPEFGSFDKLVIEPARMAFREARRRYLRPYPHVAETLKVLGERKIPVVALTDAPRNPAEYRVRLMGLDVHLAGLYTLPGFQFPASDDGEKLVAKDILQKEERGEYRAACPVVELPREWEKPNVKGLLQICEQHGVDPKHALVIGDSLKKDIAVAREVGAVDVWAEYGTYVSQEYRERLDIISAPAITKRHAASVYEGGTPALPGGGGPVLAERRSAPAKPTHAVSNFGRLLEIIDAAK